MIYGSCYVPLLARSNSESQRDGSSEQSIEAVQDRFFALNRLSRLSDLLDCPTAIKHSVTLGRNRLGGKLVKEGVVPKLLVGGAHDSKFARKSELSKESA